ncbi:glyoxylate/hydroxypyruvate reductase A [Paracoccaceae bacterium]
MTRQTKALLIAATGEDPEPYRALMTARFPELVIQAEGVDDYDPATIAYALCWFPAEGLLASLPNLEVIFSMGAGIDHILRDPALPADLPIVRLMHDKTREQMRDYALHAVLHYYRQMDLAARRQRDKTWKFIQIRPKDQFRIGLMGVGEMGRAVAQGLNDLGFSVMGWSRSPKEISGVETYSGADGLLAMAAQSAVLISILPATGETVGLLNADVFAAMPKGGVVVNLGRGNHLVTDDLLAALDNGHLGGATLDVFAPEPMPQDSPFWDHPLVRVTPHIGSDGNAEIIADSVIDNIRRVESGLPPAPLGDRARGY